MTDSEKRLHTVPTSIDLLVHTLTLAELLEGARQRQRSHIGELHRRFGPDLLRRLQVKDSTITAEELLSDIFMRLPDALDSYQERGSFEGLLWTMASNALIDKQRKRQRLPDQLDDRAELPSAARTSHTFERRDVIEKLAAELAPQQREVWLMSMEGFTNAEIAERLNTNTNNVYQLLHRAKDRLKKAAQELGITPSDLL